MRIDYRTILTVLMAAAVLPASHGQAPAQGGAAGPGGGANPNRVVPPARITEFKVQPESISAGKTATLVWATENPNGVTIDPEPGVVSPRGNRQVSPAATTTYTLTVRGPNNTTLTKTATVTVSGSAPGAAKTEAGSRPQKGAVPRMPDGKPDLSGVYNFSLRNPPRASANDGVNRTPALKPGAEKFRIVRGPLDAGRDSDCMPKGVPDAVNSPYPWQIIQTPNLIVIVYEYLNTVRFIPTDGSSHPIDPDPAWMGDSRGHWDGDTLVVDSVGFNDKTEISGFHHTTDLHIVERFRRIDFNTLQYDVTHEDSNVFEKPWVMTRDFPLRADLNKIDEFVCENNRDYTPFFQK